MKTDKNIVVLGMAKSSQDLKGAKNQKLELDLLRLIYAVKEINEGNVESYSNMSAYGVLTVANEFIKNRAERWKRKYGCSDEYIIIEIAEISQIAMMDLQDEKIANGRANTRHIDSSIGKGDASGTIGETFYEEFLKTCCKKLLKEKVGEDFTTIENPKNPFEIQWDCIMTNKKR